jgi:hypothetical protein
MSIGDGKTFDQFCHIRRVTKEERKALVWHLAAIRFGRLVEKLLPYKTSSSGADKWTQLKG